VYTVQWRSSSQSRPEGDRGTSLFWQCIRYESTIMMKAKKYYYVVWKVIEKEEGSK
jgi:hypothetical protein